jgi:sarcosine oxidase subunit gamma
VANAWKSLTALGHDAAEVVAIGSYQITERFDVALASVAVRRGQDKAFAAAAKKAGVPLPGASAHEAGKAFSAFWVTPEMWFVEADFATHEDIVAHLKPAFGETASITEQTDAWVRFDVAGAGLVALFLTITFVVKGAVIFPASAALAWSRLLRAETCVASSAEDSRSLPP